MTGKWIEYVDEPDEQISLVAGFISGWKKIKIVSLPKQIRDVCKKEILTYLVGFYAARITQVVLIYVVVMFGIEM